MKLSIDYENKAEQSIRFRVEDTGIGMKSNGLEKLQGLLRKIDLSEKVSKDSAGCGFGLTISQIIAKQLSLLRQGIKVTS